jgi:acetylcholinesterase
LGFLPGKEVKDEKVGNLGLQDRKFYCALIRVNLYMSPERLALKWVQTYISEFGGDPKKVTM